MNLLLIGIAVTVCVSLIVALYFAFAGGDTPSSSIPDTSPPTTSPAATIPSTSTAQTSTPSPATTDSTLAPSPAPPPIPTFPGLIRSTAQTPWNDEGKGNVIYLDRHDVACPSKSGMSSFKLVRKGDGNYREEYACLAGTDFGDAVANGTPANDWGQGNAVYLNRHTVSCPGGSVINQWHLTRPKADQIHFDYKCANVPGLANCESLSTPWNEDGGGNTVFLDRHQIECPQNKMFTSWKLNRKPDDLTKWRFDYTCCGR